MDEDTFELDAAHAATALTGAPIAIRVVGPGLNAIHGIRVIGSGAVVTLNNKAG